MFQFWKTLWHELQPDCLECARPSNSVFCDPCAEKLKFSGGCVRCGRRESIALCLPCAQKPKVWTSMASAFWYEGASVSLLHRMKEEQHPECYRFVEDLKIECPRPEAEALFVVPSNPRMRRKRMFDASVELGRVFSKMWGIPLIGDAFLRLPFLESQKAMNSEDRRQFIKRSIRLNRGASELRFRRILLIDDLITTTASIEACSDLLAPHIEEIHLFGLFRAPKRDGVFSVFLKGPSA